MKMGVNQEAQRSTLGTVGWVFLLLGGAVMLAPFYFMFVFSTHTRTDIFRVPPPTWFGPHFLDNLMILMGKIPFWTNLAWSLYVGALSTLLTLLFCSMAGFAFATYQFKFKKILFGLVMATMLIPAFLGMIPTFMIMDVLGWIDQPRALYLPAAAPAMGIFLMRQYIESAIPRELLEAARMDGCGEWGIYWRIVVPLLGPAFGTLGLITFIASWNNFVGPLIVMRSVERYTFPLALRSVQSPVDTEWGALMAGAVVAVLPLLVIFIFSSKRLIAGLTAGAVKS
jgi:multiple sugar transport system permease protein